MSGIVNSTGAVSGVIGTTVGTPTTSRISLTADGAIAAGGSTIITTAGKAAVAFISTENVGSKVTFVDNRVLECGIAYDANAQKVVVAYGDYSNSSYGYAIVGTISGTSISWGTPTIFSSSVVSRCSVVYDTNAQKVVIAFTTPDGVNCGRRLTECISYPLNSKT